MHTDLQPRIGTRRLKKKTMSAQPKPHHCCKRDDAPVHAVDIPANTATLQYVRGWLLPCGQNRLSREHVIDVCVFYYDGLKSVKLYWVHCIPLACPAYRDILQTTFYYWCCYFCNFIEAGAFRRPPHNYLRKHNIDLFDVRIWGLISHAIDSKNQKNKSRYSILVCKILDRLVVCYVSRRNVTATPWWVQHYSNMCWDSRILSFLMKYALTNILCTI